MTDTLDDAYKRTATSGDFDIANGMMQWAADRKIPVTQFSEALTFLLGVMVAQYAKGGIRETCTILGDQIATVAENVKRNNDRVQ